MYKAKREGKTGYPFVDAAMRQLVHEGWMHNRTRMVVASFLVNDLHGHETGDKVLQQVALRFERVLPAGALLARLGGDEFGVLYEGGHDSAVEVALALKATLSYPFHINNQEIRLGVSVGVAENKGERDLLIRADNAMYKAKREGNLDSAVMSTLI